MNHLATGRKQIIIYGKPECHLCDDARTILEDLAADPDTFPPFDLDEVDIRRDATIFERYRWRIPVVTIDGAEVAEGRIDRAGEEAIIRALLKP